MTNDTAGAQEIAKRLNLNEDTMKSISQMTPSAQITTEDAKAIADQQQIDLNQASTFTDAQKNQTLPGGRFGQMFRDLEDKYGLQHGTLATVAQREGNNPDACGVSNPRLGISSSACGLFQHINSTWAIDSARINGGVPLSPSDRLNPALSAEATAAAFAKYQNENRGLIENSGMDSRAALYAYHNLGTGSGPRFINAFAQDPNMSVNSVLSATEIRNNPSIYGNGSITLAQAQQNMIRDNGTSPRYGGSSSTFGSFTGGYSGGSNVSGSSPFSGAGFFDSGSGTGYSVPTGYSTNGYGYNSGSSGNSVTSLVTGVFTRLLGQTSTQTQGQAQNQVQYPTQQGQGVASIIAQPTSTYVGGNVLVSWSSVGTRTDQQCQTQMFTKSGTTTIGTTNEGSKVVTATVAGTMSLMITCTTYAATIIAQSTNVRVQ